MIISSGCYKAIYHRSPYDIVILGMLFGINKDKSLKCVQRNGELCVRKAAFRKAYKGTISVASKEEIARFREKEEEFEGKIVKKIKV